MYTYIYVFVIARSKAKTNKGFYVSANKTSCKTQSDGLYTLISSQYT